MSILKICILFIIFLLFGCNSNPKDTPPIVIDTPIERTDNAKEVNKTEQPDNAKENKSKPTKKVHQRLPYSNPKNLEELLSTIYIVDTLYSTVIPNGIGNKDDSYELVFNKIIAISPANNKVGNKIFTVAPLEAFKPVYEFEQHYYVTSCTDGECDQVIITKWAQTKEGLIYVDYFKNLFSQKYGRTQINDIARFNNQLYFLIETIQPNEGHELFRTIYVMKDTTDYRFKRIHTQKIIQPHGTFTGSCKFELGRDGLNVKSQIEGVEVAYKIINKGKER